MVERKTVIAAAFLAGVVTLAVYLKALDGQFLNLDDLIFVVTNPNIRNFDGDLLKLMFIRPLDIWMPLTWLSFAVDYRFWELNPFGYHLTNLFMHAANSVLVVLVAARFLNLKRREEPEAACSRSGDIIFLLLAGLLFGLHPLKVESVAWVTERKDVLSGLFGIASLCSYLGYVNATLSGTSRQRCVSYGSSFVLFCCALMSKPVAVVMPLLFLLADWYPLGRVKREGAGRLVLEKLPFLAGSLAVGALTLMFFSQRKLLVGLASLSVSDRLLYSGNALFEYARLALFPAGILPFYEMPEALPLSYILKSFALAAFCLFALWYARKGAWLPCLAAAFVLPVIPSLALFQNNDVAFAARYTYLALLAPSIAAAYAVTFGWSKPGLLVRGAAAGALVLLPYALVTMKLITVWHDSGALWSRVIEYNPATTKYMDRGVYYLINGRPEAAATDFSAAIDRLRSRGKAPDWNAHAFRGVALMDTGRYADALIDFDAALSLKSHPTYHFYRGLLLQKLGMEKDAAEEFSRAGPHPPPIDFF